ncbi:Dicer-like protein 1 [Entomortierella chlamydospora]|nr:Dicer-like protein 1 [Entomortierella chlamydospora]
MANADDLLLFEEEAFFHKPLQPLKPTLQVPDLLSDSLQHLQLTPALAPASIVPTILPIAPVQVRQDTAPGLARGIAGGRVLPTDPAPIPQNTMPEMLKSSEAGDIQPIAPVSVPQDTPPEAVADDEGDAEARYLVPRAYQDKMYKKALQRNIIAVMDTGTGKTLVSVMLIKEMARRECEARGSAERKICFFIVNNVPLVKQQASVIRSNSKLEVIEMSGPNNTKKFEKKLWNDIFEKADVVVLTAQILLDLFRHAFVKMSRAHLLVFDECHHARKDHPFCLIMREFYHDSPIQERPKIFGMTASPSLDTVSKLLHSANKLERIMDALIFTADEEELRPFIERPNEFVVQYNQSPEYLTTELSIRLNELRSSLPKLESALASEAYNLKHLGPWCTDRLLKAAVESIVESGSRKNAPEDAKIALDIVNYSRATPLECKEDYLSPKVLKLVQLLRVAAEGMSSEFCGIVFVERRDTATALCLLLQELECVQDCLRVQALVGHRDDNDRILRMSMREQNDIISNFRNNDYNLLIATSVAEEGLDVQPCNFVMRFDPTPSTTSYIQSKGRARKKDSRYVIMQESESIAEEATFEKIKFTEKTIREYFRALDPDRSLSTPDPDDANGLTVTQSYKVPSTGALLTLDSSIALLHYYCSMLAADEFSRVKPELEITSNGTSGFVCDLTLPANAPFRVIQSDRTSTKSMAKKSAAFKACEELHILGSLNDNLLPIIKRRDDEEFIEEDGESNNKEKNSDYPKASPAFWKGESPMEGARLFGCVIELTEKDLENLRGKHRYRTMCLLTYRQIPCTLAPFNLYVEGAARKAMVSDIFSSIDLERGQLELLQHFTLSMFQRLCRKTFECPLQNMPYFIAPLVKDYHKSQKLEDAVSWQDIALSQSLVPLPFEEDINDDQVIMESVLTLRNDHNRDFFVKKVLRGFRVNDVMLQDQFEAEHRSWDNAISKGKTVALQSGERTFAQYFKWKYNVSCLDDDIILAAERVHKMRNHLQPAVSEEEKRDEVATIIPLSACMRCPVLSDVLRMSQMIPSVLYNLDSTLLVQEAREKLGITGVSLDHLQVAFTTSSANRDYQYERLETLGDSFLKFASTIRLYIVNPAKDESQLHNHRIRIISNNALRKHAIGLELFRYVSSTPFHRKSWRPTRFIVDGKEWNESQTQMLSDKTLADFIEAALGAAYLSGGTKVGFETAKILRIPFDEFESWEDFHKVYTNAKAKKDSDKERSEVKLKSLHLAEVQEVEKVLGYKFKDPLLFFEAMTHASYIRDEAVCYQRLEFLGDAILDFQVIQYYYKKYPDAPPGAITLIKDASVNNTILGAISLRWGLYKYVKHSSEALGPAIEKSFRSVEEKKCQSATKTLDGEYWNDIYMPKVLGDLVESTLGAVFVDSGFDFDVITDLFSRLIRPFLDDHINFENLTLHPSKLLLEGLQKEGCNNFKFESINSQGNKVDVLRKLGLGRSSQQKQEEGSGMLKCHFKIHDTVVATATGDHIEDLKKEVSFATLAKLNSDSEFLSTLCNCPKRRGPRHVSMLDRYRQE